jgi:hypothetical protein
MRWRPAWPLNLSPSAVALLLYARTAVSSVHTRLAGTSLGEGLKLRDDEAALPIKTTRPRSPSVGDHCGGVLRWLPVTDIFETRTNSLLLTR